MGKKNRVKIQHYYTTNAVNPPKDLAYGEIAVSHTKEHEGIYLRSVIDGSNDGICKIIDSAQTQNLIDKYFRPASGSTPGYVKTFSGDVNGDPERGMDFTGYATTPSHYHSKYLETAIFNDFSAATQDVVDDVTYFFSGATDTYYNNLKNIQDRINELDGSLDSNGIINLLQRKVGYITGNTGNNIKVIQAQKPDHNGTEIIYNKYIITHTEPQAIYNTYCANPYDSDILSTGVVKPAYPNFGEGDNTEFPGIGGGVTTPVSSDNKITVYNGDSFNIINTLAIDSNGHIVSNGISAATVTIEELKQATDTQLGGVFLSNENEDIEAEKQEVGANMAANFHHKHTCYLSKNELTGSTELEQDIIISCGTWNDEEWGV